ncbi:extracellular calcium-sensing receptor-like [Pelobates fuscus]|uniref:extracellular calcium-sensing receptor-like n=1 Tax=Pelobates fuscus TaxID=191477 RepID=UPI002FE45D3A
MEEEFTVDEIDRAISRERKAPGPDGYEGSYYKTYREELTPHLLKWFNHLMQGRHPDPDMSTAHIVLIPKPGKDTTYPEHYRPISLINHDVKLLAKILADRLSPHLTNLVHADQVGFIPERQLFENTRRNIDLIWTQMTSHIPTLILSLNAEKAFDRVKWTYLFELLRHLRFPYIKMIQDMYTDVKAHIRIPGAMTAPITLHNGTRQGCPLSPLLCVLTLEPLMQAFRSNRSIEGITVGDQTYKVSGYADDVLLTLTNSGSSMMALDRELTEYGDLSGYKTWDSDIVYGETSSLAGSSMNLNVELLHMHQSTALTWLLTTEVPGAEEELQDEDGSNHKFFFRNYQSLQTLRFAVEEINGNSNILQNITLGFQIYDSCDMTRLALESALQVLTGHDKIVPNFQCFEHIPLSSMIGPSTSTQTMLVAHILGLYRYPQIGYSSSTNLLSDRTKFKSFFRTIPSDTYQCQGLAQLVLHFGWNWVGLLSIDNDYGLQGIQMVKKELVKAGACVAFSEIILTSQPERNARHIVKVIKDSTAVAIVVFCGNVDLVPILGEMKRQNITNRIFVASEAWSTSSAISLETFSDLLSGTIGLSFQSGTIPGLKEFLNKIHPSENFLVKLFWEEAFKCTFFDDNITRSLKTFIKECTGTESLESLNNSYNDVSRLRHTYSVYNAVHAVANALADMKNCKREEGSFVNGKCADIRNFKPWQLLHYLKKVKVMMSSGRELYFDVNGDPPAIYDIVNWQITPEGTIRHVKVGSYDMAAPNGQVFSINKNNIKWPTRDQKAPVSVCSKSCPHGFRKAVKRSEPACCFQCVPCPQGQISNQTDSIDCLICPWDMWPNNQKSMCLPKHIEYLSYDDQLAKTLTATSILSSLVPVVILRIFTRYKTTPIVKANNYTISCLLLVSLSLCFLCSNAFIGYPHPEKCLLRQPAFGMAFALCISCILAKTILVVFAFMATKPGSFLRLWSSPWVSYIIICIVSLLQIILSIMWLSITPPFPEVNTHANPGLICVECNEGSPIAFWSMFGYLGLLSITSFFVAFLARRLPDSFNEATFITFSMLAFLSVWVSFIPASLSSTGKYVQAMEVFAILASSWALVICMFVPKCFIILFRPDMNSKNYLMQKNPIRKK